jgi:methyl-accepting chemotaxis protein
MKKLDASLQVKIVLAVAVLCLAILASIICLNFFYQKKEMMEQFQSSTSVLAGAVYGSILYPMAVRYSETIKQQMAEFEKNSNDVKVYVFSFDKLITYTSDAKRAETDLSTSIKSPQLIEALNKLLATGKSPEKGFDELKDGTHYFSQLRPLVNQSRCHHCHGTSRAVLGGCLWNTRAKWCSKL